MEKARTKFIRPCFFAFLCLFISFAATKKARRHGELVSGNIRLLHSAGDLAAAQAACACIDMLGTSVHDRLDALHIGLPSTVGASVGMGNLNTKGYALVAKLTFCHKLKHLLACVWLPDIFRQLINNSRTQRQLQEKFSFG